MPKVYSMRKGCSYPQLGTIIDRRSKWGNPFRLRPGASMEERLECIRKYEESLTPEFKEEIRKELRGKNLLCWCAPLPCHGDVLLKIANE